MSDIQHRCTVDGQDYPFTWPEEQTLLDALLDQDIPAYYSCMEGHCGTSQVTLTGGRSHMLNNEVLGKYEIEKEDQVLACQVLREDVGPYHCIFE